jgi:hypothetical protein
MSPCLSVVREIHVAVSVGGGRRDFGGLGLRDAVSVGGLGLRDGAYQIRF